MKKSLPGREALGRRIAELRREKSFAQEALAEAMSVSLNHIADVELGARNRASGVCC